MPTPPFFFGQNTGQGPCRSGSCIIMTDENKIRKGEILIQDLGEERGGVSYKE